MAKIKSGITRFVILIGSIAIKIPCAKYGAINFIEGCLANLKERKYYKDFKGSDFEYNLADYVAPSIYCAFLGLLQIQIRCKENKFDLTEEQKAFFSPLCGSDNKAENFGYYKNVLVCLDYN